MKKAVILAGGLGSRLKPFTEAIPKPLLPIGEKAVLEIQIERLKQHGFNEIFVATNYKSNYIESFLGDGSRYGVKLHVSKETKSLGTVGPLTLLKEHLTEPFLLMNGDILSLINFEKLYNFAIKNNAKMTVAIKKIITPFAFGNILFNGDFVTKIEEKPDFINYIIAGIYVFTPKVFEDIPKDTYYGIDKLIQKYLDLNEKVAKYEMDEYWIDIGRIDDYQKAQEMYGEYFKDE